MSPKVALDKCPEKRELFTSVIAVLDRIVRLRQRELELFASGKLEDSERVDAEVVQAMEFKRTLLLKYHSHVKSHGC